MPDFTVKLIVERGATFRKVLIWKTGDPTQPNSLVPVDLTGYTAKMQMRSDVSSATVLVELSTSNGGITLGGATGEIDLYISAATTAAFTFKKAVYDLYLTAPNLDKDKFLDGTVVVTQEITR